MIAASPPRRAVVAGLAAAALAAPAQARASLQAGLEDAARRAPGLLAVQVTDVRDGPLAGVNARAPCPMHSAVKLFVCAWIEREVAAGRLAPDRGVTIVAQGAPAGVGPIDQRLARDGRVLADVRACQEAMMIASDNAATDALMALAPSPAAIAADLRLPAAIRIARDMADLYAAFAAGRTPEIYRAFLADPRDTATAEAFAAALVRLAQGRLAGPAADLAVRGLMAQSRLGAARLTDALGPDWAFAGRTGSGPTIAGRTTGTNHVGIATHRRSGRRLAIAALLRDAAGDMAAREAALARVGAAVRAVWPDG